MKILITREGKCPHCGSEDFKNHAIDCGDGFIPAQKCNACGKLFQIYRPLRPEDLGIEVDNKIDFSGGKDWIE